MGLTIIYQTSEDELKIGLLDLGHDEESCGGPSYFLRRDTDRQIETLPHHAGTHAPTGGR